MIGIQSRSLTKDYGQHRGIFDLNLEIAEGESFGYIGPNGAGKTTTMRLMLNLIRPTKGSAHILGMDCLHQDIDIKKVTGYMPAEAPTYPNETGENILNLLSNLRGGVDPERISSLAKRFELDLKRKYREYSHGNKQKIWLIQAIMHDPKVLILDEPTSGLDPIMQQQFRELLGEAKKRGTTILLSSHVLPEVQELCDRIGVVHDGTLRQIGTMEELRIGNIHMIDATVEHPITEEQFKHIVGITNLQVSGTRIQCTLNGTMGPLLQTLQASTILSLESSGMSLEEVFLAEYGQTTNQ